MTGWLVLIEPAICYGRYELPDGSPLDIGGDRFRVSEILFNPLVARHLPFVSRAAVCSDIANVSLNGGQNTGKMSFCKRFDDAVLTRWSM